jgi:hypothetical protein
MYLKELPTWTQLEQLIYVQNAILKKVWHNTAYRFNYSEIPTLVN